MSAVKALAVTVLSLGAFAAVALCAAPASAQSAGVGTGDPDGGYERRDLPERTWRRNMAQKEEARRKRAPGRYELFEPSHFAFELRFGPYWPEVDEPFGGSGPYELFFDDDPLFYFGVEVDWLLLHIPYVGSLGPGVSWGIVQAGGKTRLQDDINVEAGADTGLLIMPMYGAAVFRLDGPLRESRFPIVPHAKLGLGWGIWRATARQSSSRKRPASTTRTSTASGCGTTSTASAATRCTSAPPPASSASRSTSSNRPGGR
jgi:hypothetical protein